MRRAARHRQDTSIEVIEFKVKAPYFTDYMLHIFPAVFYNVIISEPIPLHSSCSLFHSFHLFRVRFLSHFALRTIPAGFPYKMFLSSRFGGQRSRHNNRACFVPAESVLQVSSLSLLPMLLNISSPSYVPLPCLLALGFVLCVPSVIFFVCYFVTVYYELEMIQDFNCILCCLYLRICWIRRLGPVPSLLCPSEQWRVYREMQRCDIFLKFLVNRYHFFPEFLNLCCRLLFSDFH